MRRALMADEILLRLPFDQYGRYRMVREASKRRRVTYRHTPQRPDVQIATEECWDEQRRGAR